MNMYKLQLLAATAAVAALGGSAAQAQFAIGATSINGAGASLPQNIIRQSGDCYGLKTDLGFGTTGTPSAAVSLFDFDFNTPAADTLGNRFDCAGNGATAPIVAPNFGAPRAVQPNVTVRYLSTGSGQGITAWLNGRVSSTFNVSPTFTAYAEPDGYQYSVSETALSSTNLATYNGTLVVNGNPVVTTINPFNRYAAADTAANLFGAAIQIPVVVAPVALAYDPVYAKVRNNGGLINEFRFVIAGARADGSGGLKLTRAQYCGILNGTITNWNQLPTTVVNKDINDPAPFNVPIRLVGRSEDSGTTSLFTRAIAAQCGATIANGGTNRFSNSEPQLPYDASVQVAGTTYTGGASTINPNNSLSGAFFDKATQAVTIGTEAPGLFGVANGNDGVAGFVNLHADPSSTIGDRTLNGRIGYASPEQLLPATLFNGANGFGLHSASLQVNGTGTVFAGPDAKQANAAFTGIQPPQSKGTAGAYCTSGCTGVGSGVGDRANPLDWVQIADKSVSLAAPTKGYPLVGTSNVLLYTCYATPQRRQTVNGFFATLIGKTPKDHNNQAMNVGILSDVTNGLFTKNGLAPMPAAWRAAIAETFLKKSTQVGVVGNATTQLGLRNLWIQDKIPTSNTGAGAVTNGNSLCVGKPGA